jgi:hypothetical protein
LPAFTRCLRFFADILFARRYGHRAVVLETVLPSRDGRRRLATSAFAASHGRRSRLDPHALEERRTSACT